MFLLSVLTVILMLVTTYAFWREGLLTAVTTLVNVLVSGLLAFNFFEPLAGQLASMFQNSFLQGFEDCLALIIIFTLSLGVLRVIVNKLASTELDYPPLLLQGGKVVCGLLTGYLLAGFLTCAFLTMPWPQKKAFGNFDPTVEQRNSTFPPDQVWLAMMHRAGNGPFARGKRPTFDPNGNFELRYHRYRHFEGNNKNNVTKDDGLLPVK